jgi:hypothetical protein
MDYCAYKKTLIIQLVGQNSWTMGLRCRQNIIQVRNQESNHGEILTKKSSYEPCCTTANSVLTLIQLSFLATGNAVQGLVTTRILRNSMLNLGTRTPNFIQIFCNSVFIW